MISQLIMIATLVSIWFSLAWSLTTLTSAVCFWLKHSRFKVDMSPLDRYPLITIVVPAHNEEVVIAQTARAILDLNYPEDKVQLLLFADNCSDNTYQEMQNVQALPQYANRNMTLINRKGRAARQASSTTD